MTPVKVDFIFSLHERGTEFNVYVGFSFGILHSVFFPTPEMTLPCLWAQFLCLWGINNNSKITQKEGGKLKGIIKICLPAVQRI
jgi:hypothetical protein